MKNPPKQYETIHLDFKWTVAEEAIHRGHNYAEHNKDLIKELMRDEGMPFHAVLKQAYVEGFLHGFEHKFDQTNYEEKK